MKPSCTAKDDHPGPTGRRHISTGGDFDQSVSRLTPAITPSRRGPRKPGHSRRLIEGSVVAGPASVGVLVAAADDVVRDGACAAGPTPAPFVDPSTDLTADEGDALASRAGASALVVVFVGASGLSIDLVGAETEGVGFRSFRS